MRIEDCGMRIDCGFKSNNKSAILNPQSAMRSRLVRLTLILISVGVAFADAEPPAAPGGRGASGGRGGRGERGAVQVMTLTSSAWPDGGQIPLKYTQAGEEASPPLAWSNVPVVSDAAASFVLIVHDVDAAVGNGTDDLLHWMLWNIPGTATGLPERVPPGSQLPDGTR